MKFRDCMIHYRVVATNALVCVLCASAFLLLPNGCGHDLAVRIDSYLPSAFWISLHSPMDDQVISKNMYENLRYESIDELQAVCSLPTVRCSDGSLRLFVEVGSAVGAVSLYAASRGMRVIALDPLAPNVRRLKQSQCLNSCPISHSMRCANFASDRFTVLLNLVGAQPDPMGRAVESEPRNLAATMRGGGEVRASNVSVVTLDEVLGSQSVKLLLLTCQGAELDALFDTVLHLASRHIRHIVWRRHYTANAPVDVAKAKAMVNLLWASGFRFFYDLEDSRRLGVLPRLMTSELEVLEYQTEAWYQKPWISMLCRSASMMLSAGPCTLRCASSRQNLSRKQWIS
jgi:FkbM family methyltransferase